MPNSLESLPMACSCRMCSCRMGAEYRKSEKDACKRILEGVAAYWGISEQDLLGKCREIQFAWPRQVAIYLIFKSTGLTTRQIGAIFHCDHGNVSYAAMHAKDLVHTYPHLKDEVERCQSKISSLSI